MELVRKKEFAVTAFDLKDKIFVVHVIFLTILNISKVYPFYITEIVSLQGNKAPSIVFPEYFNFANIFSPKLAVKLPKYPEINNHTIDLFDGSKQPNKPIYNLEPVELQTLKIYIETNLANSFITPPKFSVDTPIFFD